MAVRVVVAVTVNVFVPSGRFVNLMFRTLLAQVVETSVPSELVAVVAKAAALSHVPVNVARMPKKVVTASKAGAELSGTAKVLRV